MSNTTKDAVCGMDIKTDSKFSTKYEDKLYYFCSENCLDKFKAKPKSFINQESKSSGGCCGGSHH